MIKRTIVAVLAALALLFVGTASPAQAAGTSRTCHTTGSQGVDVTFTLFYDSSSGRHVSNWSWSTSPGALLNRVELHLQDGGGLWSPASAAGGTAATVDDVPSSQVGYTGGSLPIQMSGGSYKFKFSAWGGSGSSTGSCTTNWQGF